MTVLLATGFEHGTHEIVSTSYYAGITTSATYAHTGGYGIQVSGATGGYWRVPTGTVSAIYLSFWMKIPNYPGSGTVSITAQGQCSFVTTNSLLWSARAGSTTVATATSPLPDNDWHHYKIYMYVHDTVGRMKMDVDSITFIDFTGDTKPSTGSTFTYAGFEVRNAFLYLDDVIVDDAQNWVDVRFNGLIPNSDVTTDWTPSTGSTHYTLVDEVPYNDADYLETNTDAQQEIYGLTDWTGTNKTPQMTVTWVRALKTTADTQKLKLIIKSGATTDVGTAQDVFTAATYLSRIDETDPNTGVAWTDSGIDAMQIGYESEI